MKVLLLTDAPVNVDRGGFSQTLYNLFSFLQPADMLIITARQANRDAPASPPFQQRTLTYNLEWLPVQKNRLAGYTNSFIYWFNYTAAGLRKFGKMRSAIRKFNPSVVVCAPNGAEGLLIYFQLKPAFEQKKILPYFMDDWLYQSRYKWLDERLHRMATNLLSHNKRWLMISESLAGIFSGRYNIQPSAVLEIHNPVNISNLAPPAALTKKNRYTIAYAGALWPMHFDAFVVMAQAVTLLSKTRGIQLLLYTTESQWQWRKNHLQGLAVTYGGHVPYSAIHATLQEADCLLVTSSFTDAWQTHSKGSVQTKLTDYMKAGRLIIGAGLRMLPIMLSYKNMAVACVSKQTTHSLQPHNWK